MRGECGALADEQLGETIQDGSASGLEHGFPCVQMANLLSIINLAVSSKSEYLQRVTSISSCDVSGDAN